MGRDAGPLGCRKGLESPQGSSRFQPGAGLHLWLWASDPVLEPPLPGHLAVQGPGFAKREI